MKWRSPLGSTGNLSTIIAVTTITAYSVAEIEGGGDESSNTIILLLVTKSTQCNVGPLRKKQGIQKIRKRTQGYINARSPKRPKNISNIILANAYRKAQINVKHTVPMPKLRWNANKKPEPRMIQRKNPERNTKEKLCSHSYHMVTKVYSETFCACCSRPETRYLHLSGSWESWSLYPSNGALSVRSNHWRIESSGSNGSCPGAGR